MWEAAGGRGEKWVSSLCCRAQLRGYDQGLGVEAKAMNRKLSKQPQLSGLNNCALYLSILLEYSKPVRIFLFLL